MRLPNKIMMESIIVYSHYEYEDSPLFILRAGMPCNRAEFSNAADILAALDEWYGNTEQETTEWALEFEIWARFLLLNGGLILNPQHLALEEVKDEFLELLNDGPENIRTRYEQMFAANMESLKAAWIAADKPEQFEFDPGACSSREGKSMLLATKLKNRILLAAKPEDLPLKIELKNIVINGVKRGCSGFVTNMQTGSCVYIDTEKLVYGPLSDKCMYRYARDNKDYSSNCLQNGWNRWATDEELPKQVVGLLREGIGIVR